MKSSALATLLCIATTTSAAWAGSKDVYPVTINTTNRSAEGALGSVRNSADSRQVLGCTITAYNSGASSGHCFAVNAAGDTAVCYTNAPELLEQIRAINGDTYLRFIWDSSSTCTSIFLSKFSVMAPKAP